MIDNFSTDFLVRHPRMSDLEAVHRLLEVCDIAEYGAPDFTLEDLRTLWQGPTFNLATDAWIVIASGDRLVGYADVQHRQHRQHVRMLVCVDVRDADSSGLQGADLGGSFSLDFSGPNLVSEVVAGQFQKSLAQFRAAIAVSGQQTANFFFRQRRLAIHQHHVTADA